MGKLSNKHKRIERFTENSLSKNEVIHNTQYEAEWHKASVSALDDTAMKYLQDVCFGKYSIVFGSFVMSETAGLISTGCNVYFEHQSDHSMFVMFYELRKGSGDKF
jgi:hypothetical protein